MSVCVCVCACVCEAIDIRVEGLETGSINTASRVDSSMFLVLRPLIIFEMAACSNATAPFVEPITQLNKKKSQLHCCEWNLDWKILWSMFC